MNNNVAAEAFYVDDLKVASVSLAGPGPNISIDSPSDGHDTNVTSIMMAGTVSNADIGDSVVITNSLGSVDTVAVQADSSWTAPSVELVSGADSVVANLKDTGPTSSTVAQDTITVNLDQTAPDSAVTGVTLNDTGHFAFEAKWDTFASDPDTGSGFGQWVVFYKKGTGVTTSDSRWDSDSDADLTSFLSGDSTVVGSGLDDNVQFSFRVTYEDGATNLGPLSSEVTFTTREQTLVINELNIDPAVEGSGEWIELYNAASDTILIDNFTVETSDVIWTIPDNNWQIAPGKSITIVSNAAEFDTQWGFLPNFAAVGAGPDTDVGSPFNFTNTDDTAALFDANGNLLDSLRWGGPVGAQNNFAIATVDADGTASTIRETEGDEGRTTAVRPEVGEFTERLDQTFNVTSGGAFDSEGPDTDGLSTSAASIAITSPADGFDTTGSVITVSGTAADAGAGDTVSILAAGVLVDTTTVDGVGNWTASSVEITAGANTIEVRLHYTDVNSNVRATDQITVNKVDQLAVLQLSEVSPGGDGSSDASPNDWVEIHVVDSGVIGTNWQVVDDEGGFIKLDVIDTTVQLGDIIVVHVELGTSDTTTIGGGSGPDAGADQWDVYGSGLDWPGSADGAAMIRQGPAGSAVMDFVAWGDHTADNLETVDAAVQDDLDTAIAAGEWGTIEAGVKRQFDLVRAWKATAGAGQRVVYRDPNVASDTKSAWDAVTVPTLGAPNDLTNFQSGVGSGTASVKPQAIIVGDTGQTLDFTYDPTVDFSAGTEPFGQVSIRIPAGWPDPSLGNSNAEGFITVEATNAGSNEPDSFTYVDGGDTLVIFTFNDNFNGTTGDTVRIVYGDRSLGGPGLSVPSAPGTDTFFIQADPTGNQLERLAPSDQPSEVIVANPDTINLTPNTDPGGIPGDTTTVTATVLDASGNTLAGAKVSFVITKDPTGGASPTITDTTPASGETDENGEVTITFTTDPEAAGVNAVRGDVSGVTGSDTFTRTTMFAGSGQALISPSGVQINSTDTFTVTYTASLASTGGTIALVIPTGRGWTAPTTGGGAGDVSASSSNATLGAVTVNGDTVLVPFTSLPDNGEIRITYAQATAPSTSGDDTFVVKSAGTGEPLQEIASSPVVAVRQFAVVINEALPGALSDWNGDGTVNDGDDFIEIFNFGNSSVDISSWMVDDEDNTNDPDSFPASGVSIPAKGHAVAWDTGNFVIFDSNGDSISSGSLQSSGFGLDGGTADTVQLFDSSGVVVQQISYNNESAGFQNVNSDRTIERQIDNWPSFVRDSNSNFNGLPTPGLAFDTTGDTPGPANGTVEFNFPATVESTKNFTATAWVANANGETVTDFDNAVDLGVNLGAVISPGAPIMSSGEKTFTMNIDAVDSAVHTVSGTFAVTTTGTSAITVTRPDIDTGALVVGDGTDTHAGPTLNNKVRLAVGINHTVIVNVKSADTVTVFFRRDGQPATTSDSSAVLSNTSADTWQGTIASTDFEPGDSINLIIQAEVGASETETADSSGAGFQYRVDPFVDSGPITVADLNDTLTLADLDGSGLLNDGESHTVTVRIEGGDTAWINDTATNIGAVATDRDTQVFGTQVGSDTWQFIIPDNEFNTADTLNFIITVQIFTGQTAVDTTVEDSGGFGFAYEVGAAANTPPEVDLLYPDTGIYVGGDVSGTFVLSDAEDNFCTATLQYSDDSGVSWNTASLAGNNPREFSASTGGDTHTFSWNSDLDISNREDTDVKFRIYAFDGAETSNYDTSGLFTIDNKSPPKIVDLGSTTAISGPDTGVFLSWTFNDTDLQFFNIYRTFRTADTATATILDTAAFTGGSHFYQDASVTRGDSFYYYITAQDTAGNESDSSNVTTGPFVSISKIYNDTAYFRPGDTIVYTIRYTNEGFGPTGEIILEDAIPDSATLSDTPEVVEGPAATIEYKVGGSYQSGFDSTATAVRWTISEPQDPLASGYTGRVRFRVNIE
jgi:hypothetical protein